MDWSLALCHDDAKQDPVVYGAEFGVVVFLAEGPRTVLHPHSRRADRTPMLLYSIYTNNILYMVYRYGTHFERNFGKINSHIEL